MRDTCNVCQFDIMWHVTSHVQLCSCALWPLLLLVQCTWACQVVACLPELPSHLFYFGFISILKVYISTLKSLWRYTSKFILSLSLIVLCLQKEKPWVFSQANKQLGLALLSAAPGVDMVAWSLTMYHPMPGQVSTRRNRKSRRYGHYM